ncbi:MAG TPA: hypothetical protein DEB42_02650 [Jeotgalicoccus sp.]|nr:hypothetical protein [Jeotgalicoccus sp.]
MRRLKLISVLFFSSIILSACSNPFDQLADEINGWLGSESANTSEESNDSEKDDDTDSNNETDNDTASDTEEIETLDYSHLMNQGEAVTLDEGMHEVGKDIEPGRYVITADSGYGNIYVKNEEERGGFNETLAGESDSPEGQTTEIVGFLDEGYSVEIANFENVYFTPYETVSVETIFPGQWVAGEDFPAGVYDVSMPETEETGSLEVSSHPDYNKSRHTLGSAEYGGMTNFTMSFEDGDIVNLRYMPEITLTKR